MLCEKNILKTYVCIVYIYIEYKGSFLIIRDVVVFM